MGQAFLSFIEKISRGMRAISSAALLFIMFLTVADVCLRNLLHKPIIGTYEMVGLGGAIVIGFAMSHTTWMRGHIFVDFFIRRYSKNIQAVFNITTRILSMALFLLVAWNLSLYANSLYASGEVTLTRHLPFYPIAYGLAVCCIVQCLVLITDIIKIAGGTYE